jgi:lipopolysaccharide export LptBFGC system permease protein LptF
MIRSLFLALGKAGRLPSEVAAWAPQLLFLSIGCFLFWLRASNRDIASLFLRKA